jgi:membrane protein YdbS with pleckstrin-like domain
VSGNQPTLSTPGARHYAKHLLPYEDVVAAERRHWARLIEPGTTVVLTLVVAFWLDAKVPENVPLARDIIWLGWVFLVLRLAYRYVEWRTDWFIATNKRVLLTYGVWTRKVAMMPLMKVTDMSYNRSVLGRIFGYGEFVLESAGQDQALKIMNFVPNPENTNLQISNILFGSSPAKAKGIQIEGQVDPGSGRVSLSGQMDG